MKPPLSCAIAGLILLATNLAQSVPHNGSFETFDNQARAGRRLNVVFFGGLFTEGAGLKDIRMDSWRERFQQFLVGRYPRAEFRFDLVSLGDSGSKRAMFYSRNVLSQMKPDLVFVDFLIEDGIKGEDRETLAAYEGILHDFARGGVPIMQVFTGVRAVQGNSWKPVMPQRLRDYLEFVTLYRTGVGESYQTLHQVLASKQYTMDDIWPDDAKYPSAIGHDLIFASLRDGYLKAVAQNRFGMIPSKPVFAWYYRSRDEVVLGDHPLPDGWSKSQGSLPSIPNSGKSGANTLATWESGAEKIILPLRLNFRGTMVAISGEAGADNLDFKMTIDGKPVLPPVGTDKKKRLVWTIAPSATKSEKTEFWLELTSRLSPGPHSLELTPVVEDSGRVGQLRIRSIFSAGE